MRVIVRVLLFLGVFFASAVCVAEEDMLDNVAYERQALLMVERWQLAYQNKDLNELTALYADKIDYFHKTMTREKVMADKAAFFNSEKKKFLSQSIVSTITVHADGNNTDDGGLDDSMRAEFIKQVNVGGKTQNYPASLYIKPNAAGQWQIIAESDGITDANLGFDDDSRQVVKGKFDGLQRQYAWVNSRNAQTGGDCHNGDDCNCYLWTSQAEVKPVIIPQCINASLDVVSGLDGSGRDRLQLIDQRWQGGWAAVHLYDIQRLQWTPAIRTVSTNISEIEQVVGALVTPDPAKPGYVRIIETTSAPDTAEFINKTEVLLLNTLPAQ